jgi:hypothetical protein
MVKKPINQLLAAGDYGHFIRVFCHIMHHRRSILDRDAKLSTGLISTINNGHFNRQAAQTDHLQLHYNAMLTPCHL